MLIFGTLFQAACYCMWCFRERPEHLRGRADIFCLDYFDRLKVAVARIGETFLTMVDFAFYVKYLVKIVFLLAMEYVSTFISCVCENDLYSRRTARER